MPESIEALLGDELCDACWTDPPYNVDYSGFDGKKIKNDELSDKKFRALLDTSFAMVSCAIKPGAAVYIAHADTEGLNFRGAFKAAGLKLSGCLIWVKNALVLGRADYQWRHEPILYGWKPGKSHRFFGGRCKTTVLEAVDDLPVRLHDGVLQIDIGETTLVISGDNLQIEEVVSSIIRVEKPVRNTDHPTMKPVSLILEHVHNSTTVGDVVFDPFGGSGSTLIACQKSSRLARLIELDERYCDTIVTRWQDFTGNIAIRESDGRKMSSLKPRSAA
jgi:DNA modification methylase